MNVVLDASAAIGLVVSKRREVEIQKALNEAGQIFVPDLYACEIVNTLWKYRQSQKLKLEICGKYLSQMLNLPHEMISSASLAQDSMELCFKSKNPAYDHFYFALARKVGAGLITLDKEMAKDAMGFGIPTMDLSA